MTKLTNEFLKGLRRGLNLLMVSFFFFSSLSCSMMHYYELRSMLLKPVDYSGALCRISDSTVSRILTPRVISSNPKLASDISRLLGKYVETYALSVFDPVSGYNIKWNPDLQFHAASTYKTAVYLAVMKMDQDKQISIDDSTTMENTFPSVVDNSDYSVYNDASEPDLAFKEIGKTISIKKILSYMVENSSNLSTNMIIKIYGLSKINAVLRNLGSPVEVKRGVSDDKAYADCINNAISARQLENIYRIIFDKTFFNETHRKQMIDTLEKNTETTRLPANLPKDVKVAHKHGNTSKVFHDAGIIFPNPDEPYFITILTSGYKSEQKTSQAIAEVSLLVYDEIIKERSK